MKEIQEDQSMEMHQITNKLKERENEMSSLK